MLSSFWVRSPRKGWKPKILYFWLRFEGDCDPGWYYIILVSEHWFSIPFKFSIPYFFSTLKTLELHQILDSTKKIHCRKSPSKIPENSYFALFIIFIRLQVSPILQIPPPSTSTAISIPNQHHHLHQLQDDASAASISDSEASLSLTGDNAS